MPSPSVWVDRDWLGCHRGTHGAPSLRRHGLCVPVHTGPAVCQQLHARHEPHGTWVSGAALSDGVLNTFETPFTTEYRAQDTCLSLLRTLELHSSCVCVCVCVCVLFMQLCDHRRNADEGLDWAVGSPPQHCEKVPTKTSIADWSVINHFTTSSYTIMCGVSTTSQPPFTQLCVVYQPLHNLLLYNFVWCDLILATDCLRVGHPHP